MRIVIATHNRKKSEEMTTILSRRFPMVEFKTLADYPAAREPEETGETYAENAAIKAESAAALTGELSIADDAGLEIDALDGAPGLRSKRFGGEDLSFPEKMAMILTMLKDVPEAERKARFRCCVAISGLPTANCKLQTVVFEATCEGQVARSPSGAGGFGYDPIFFLPELGCCMADLSPDQKHAVSHRGKVLKVVGDWLEERLAT